MSGIAEVDRSCAKLELWGSTLYEIILRTEEFFGIVIADDEAASVRTVGEFYALTCVKLGLQPLASPVTSALLPKVTEKEKGFLFFAKHTPLPPPSDVLPWSSQSVWDCLVAVLTDQLVLKPSKILPEARFVEDLGVD